MTVFAMLLFLGFGICLVAFGARMRASTLKARNWPSTAGTIVDLNFNDAMDPSFDKNDSSYQVEVRYEYWVSGIRYESTRIAFGYTAGPNYKKQLALYNKLKADSSVTVRHNPQNPRESSLEYVPNTSGRNLVLFGLMWIALTGGFCLLYVFSGTGAIR